MIYNIKKMKKILLFLIPPPQWRMAATIVLGIIVGLAFFIFLISKATSYLSDKPETCINCHVMYPQYASWKNSSHHAVTNCTDCHVPNHNIFLKYYFKASDGARHATIFTARAEPQVISIKQAGANAVQQNCKRCHMDLVEMTSLVEHTYKSAHAGDGKLCWDCHREVPHGSVRSLSSAPFSLVPRLPSITPDWLSASLKQNNK